MENLLNKKVIEAEWVGNGVNLTLEDGSQHFIKCKYVVGNLEVLEDMITIVRKNILGTKRGVCVFK